jgi:hypothetical protein
MGKPDALPLGGDFAFHHYLEFDKPCLVFADVVSGTGERTIVRVVFEQDGVTAAEGILELLNG